jgi:hypothetical protein
MVLMLVNMFHVKHYIIIPAGGAKGGGCLWQNIDNH